MERAGLYGPQIAAMTQQDAPDLVFKPESAALRDTQECNLPEAFAKSVVPDVH